MLLFSGVLLATIVLATVVVFISSWREVNRLSKGCTDHMLADFGLRMGAEMMLVGCLLCGAWWHVGIIMPGAVPDIIDYGLLILFLGGGVLLFGLSWLKKTRKDK